MGAFPIVVLTLVLVSSAPWAAASDPLYEPLCPIPNVCAGAGMCVANVACVPRGCDAFASCQGAVGLLEPECMVNATIDGRTCATYAGLDVDVGGGTRAGFMAHASNGSVRAFNLDNTWIAPGADAHVAVAGFGPGRAFVSAYRSDIVSDHTWTQIGVVAGIDGGPALVVGVELLDGLPEGCFVRTPREADPDLECPSLEEVYDLLALP